MSIGPNDLPRCPKQRSEVYHNLNGMIRAWRKYPAEEISFVEAHRVSEESGPSYDERRSVDPNEIRPFMRESGAQPGPCKVVDVGDGSQRADVAVKGESALSKSAGTTANHHQQSVSTFMSTTQIACASFLALRMIEDTSRCFAIILRTTQMAAKSCCFQAGQLRHGIWPCLSRLYNGVRFYGPNRWIRSIGIVLWRPRPLSRSQEEIFYKFLSLQSTLCVP